MKKRMPRNWTGLHCNRRTLSLDEPQSTLKNETLSDLVDETNQANNLSEKVDERSVNFKIVIGTLTSSNDTKGDLTICLIQHQTGGSLLKRITMVCAWRNVKSLSCVLTIYLPRLLRTKTFYSYEVQLRRNPGVGGWQNNSWISLLYASLVWIKAVRWATKYNLWYVQGQIFRSSIDLS